MAESVPVFSFLDKYNPEQFELLGCAYDYGRPVGWSPLIDMLATVDGTSIYKRLLIRHKSLAVKDRNDGVEYVPSYFSQLPQLFPPEVENVLN